MPISINSTSILLFKIIYLCDVISIVFCDLFYKINQKPSFNEYKSIYNSVGRAIKNPCTPSMYIPSSICLCSGLSIPSAMT